MAVAERFEITRPHEIMGRVDDAVEQWPAHARDAGLGDAAAAVIQKHHHRLR